MLRTNTTVPNTTCWVENPAGEPYLMFINGGIKGYVVIIPAEDEDEDCQPVVVNDDVYD
jgi:hypothetical protein